MQGDLAYNLALARKGEAPERETPDSNQYLNLTGVVL